MNPKSRTPFRTYGWLVSLLAFALFVWTCTTAKKTPTPAAEKPFERVVVDKDPPVTPEEVKEIRATTRIVSGGTTLRLLEIGKLGRAERNPEQANP